MAENEATKFTDKYTDFYEVNSKRYKGLIKIQVSIALTQIIIL